MKINKNINFSYHLYEANNNGPQFCLLDNEGNIRNKPIRCKDYIQDVYWSELLKKGIITQFGFTWDGNNNNPISKQKRVLVLMMSDDNTNLSSKQKNILNFLNPIEKSLKLFKTRLIKDDDTDNNIIFNYDNRWAKIPCLISLYYLLIRVAIHYEGKPNIDDVLNWLNKDCINLISNVDKSMMLNLIKENKFEKLFKEKITIPQKWTDYNHSSTVHNNSGIVSYKF